MSISHKKRWKMSIGEDMNKAELRRATGLSSFTIAEIKVERWRCDYVPVH